MTGLGSFWKLFNPKASKRAIIIHIFLIILGVIFILYLAKMM